VGRQYKFLANVSQSAIEDGLIEDEWLRLMENFGDTFACGFDHESQNNKSDFTLIE